MVTQALQQISAINDFTPVNDFNLNWSEKELPEKIRTKHVHRLHPYMGKFVPQIVEVFLRKYSPAKVCDPFMGSGTTLVQAQELGIDSVGADISEFNCLLAHVKTKDYDIQKLEREVKKIVATLKGKSAIDPEFKKYSDILDTDYLRRWFAPKAKRELLFFRELIKGYENEDFFKIVLSRAARSARLTTHFDLDFPKTPQTGPYFCKKHSRICRPTDGALKFLVNYSINSLDRVKEFSMVKQKTETQIVCGDSREIEFPEIDFVITSPPYVGLIDYHEQHRYAFELLGLKDNEKDEIGAARNGKSKKAEIKYIQDIKKVFANAAESLEGNGRMVVVVHDENNLYDEMPDTLGLVKEHEIERHVNRRTGRRNANDFFEKIFVWAKP